MMSRERSKFKRAVATLLGALVLVALIVGCGGGSDSGSATGAASGGEVTIATSSLSKDEFLKKAEAACGKIRNGLFEKANAYIVKHESQVPEPVLIANMAKAVMLPGVEEEMDAIRKLGAPEGDEEEIEAILAGQQEAIDKARKLKRAQSLEQVESLFLKATDRYYAYGFDACVNSV